MRRLLLELYLTSSLTILVLGVLMGRLSVPREAAAPTAALSGEAARPTLDAEAAAGRRLFRAQCASCHALDLRTDLTGPALGGAPERWADYPAEDLAAWIRNSQALVASGHPRAEALVAEWNAVMPAFPQLTDGEVAALVAFMGSDR